MFHKYSNNNYQNTVLSYNKNKITKYVLYIVWKMNLHFMMFFFLQNVYLLTAWILSFIIVYWLYEVISMLRLQHILVSGLIAWFWSTIHLSAPSWPNDEIINVQNRAWKETRLNYNANVNLCWKNFKFFIDVCIVHCFYGDKKLTEVVIWL